MHGNVTATRLRASQIASRRWFVGLMCLATLLAGAAWGVGWQSGNAASPRLVIEAPEEVHVGQPIDIRLVIHDANGISAFETTIGFDTTIATLQSVRSQENDLARLGQNVRQLGPIEVPEGIALGAYTCPSSGCTDVVGKQRGINGDQETFLLSAFTIVAEQHGPLTIDLSSIRFADGTGHPVSVDLTGARVTVNVLPNGAGE